MKVARTLEKSAVACAFVIALACCAIPAAMAYADDGKDVGGWSEEQGYFIVAEASGDVQPLANSQVQHTGKAEQKSINGTTNKRAHGWTTWAGKYHYTTAQLEHYGPFCSGVFTSSGRQWGWSGTEAYTAWRPFKPNACCDNIGQARTYYGSN